MPTPPTPETETVPETVTVTVPVPVTEPLTGEAVSVPPVPPTDDAQAVALHRDAWVGHGGTFLRRADGTRVPTDPVTGEPLPAPPLPEVLEFPSDPFSAAE